MIEARGGWWQEAEDATEEQTEKGAKAENVLFDEYRVSQQIFNRILDI